MVELSVSSVVKGAPLSPSNSASAVSSNSSERSDASVTYSSSKSESGLFGSSSAPSVKSEIWKNDRRVLIGMGIKGTRMVIRTRITKTTKMEIRKVGGTRIIGMIKTEMMIGRVLKLDAFFVVVILPGKRWKRN